MKKMKYPFHLYKKGGNEMNMEVIIEKQRNKENFIKLIKQKR